MTLSISKTDKSKGGRPRTNATPVLVRLQPDHLKALDLFASAAEASGRPDAIRAILAEWLATHGFLKRVEHEEPAGPATEAVRAMDVAIREHQQKGAKKY